jgi:hypothetical protein
MTMVFGFPSSNAKLFKDYADGSAKGMEIRVSHFRLLELLRFFIFVL